MAYTCSTCHVYCYGGSLCPRCLDKQSTDQINKSLEEKNDELHDLRSRLAFLRLQPVRQQSDDIQKWDAAIVVQGKSEEPVHAHRFILACQKFAGKSCWITSFPSFLVLNSTHETAQSSKSRVFSTMFDIKMSEEETGAIYIDDATLPVVHAMIDFCYSAEIDFTDDVTAEEVLKVAHKYQIALLQSICEKHLIKTLNNSNLSKRLRLAKTFDAKVLTAPATQYFKTHFDEVIDDVLAELG